MAQFAGHARRTDGGFSLMEIVIVCLVLTVASAMAVSPFRSVRTSAVGNANLRKIEAILKLARERAINERRAVTITFSGTNRIILTRQNMPAGTTQIADTYLENRVAFMLFAGVPDTPDGFGRNAAIDFGAAVSVMFTTDGTLTDQLGNTINGTVYIGQTGEPLTARALTVFGPTATMRSYRWNGTAWSR